MIPVAFTDMRLQDRSLILDSWTKSHRAEYLIGMIPWPAYETRVLPHIRRILATSRVVVACNPDDEAQVFGWACAHEEVLYYLYTKLIFRSQGLAHQLLAKLGLAGGARCAFYTRAISRWPGMRYEPILLKEVP